MLNACSHIYLVIHPSYQIHLPEFGQGLSIQPSVGDDIQMDDATIPLAPFEEAEGDDAYVEAVKQAVADQYVLNINKFTV